MNMIFQKNEILWVCFAAALLSVCVPTKAQSVRNTSASTELLLDGDDIVTTATRSAQKLSDAPAAVTVISAADIAASGATNIPELLKNVPGVDVEEPNEAQPNVAIRGFNALFSNTVLVMVDGRRINEDFHSSVFWTTDPILLSRIKRIEVVRGPGSVLYGADAFSGVINIILKTPAEMAAENKPGTFVGQYENHTTTFAETTYTAISANKQWAATFGAAYHGLTGPYLGQPNKPQDSYNVPMYTLDVQKQTARGSLILTGETAIANADLDNQIGIYGSFHTSTLSLSYNEDRGADPVTARYYGSFLTINGGIVASASSGEFDIQQLRPISPQNSMTYGATYRTNTDKTSLTGPSARSEELGSLFLQDQDQLGTKTTLFAGLRDDEHSLYGTQISTRVSLVHHLTPTHTLRLSYGTAFSAPAFYDSYTGFAIPIAPGLDLNYVGNTKLTPEKISSVEAGYRVDLPEGYADLSLFDNATSDIIVALPVQFASAPYPTYLPTKIEYENEGSARSEGLEIEGGMPLPGGWTSLANYSYQYVTNDDGQPEDLSPHHMVNLVLQSAQQRRFAVYFAGHFVGSTTSDSHNLRSYMTVDGRLAYRLGHSDGAWTAAVAATNLLNDQHEEYYDTPGPNSADNIAVPAQRTVRIELSGSY
jgi:outer membrane receptor for ferrienterochelin and colicin